MDNTNIANIKAEYAKYDLKYYTQNEEIANAITHGLGSVLAIAGLVYMLIISKSWLNVVTSVLFCLPAFMVYTNSCIYHALTNLKVKSAWRKVDHANISFIVIACSVPLCLNLSTNPFNYIALAICLSIGTINAIFCIKCLLKYKNWAVFLEFIIGAVVMVVVFINQALIPTDVKILYGVGALICILGVTIFGVKTQYVHTIFHLFELVGPALMYFGAIRLF